MNRGQSSSRHRLIIFGRYPVPGRTKTRLIPALGPAGAADLQRRLTENILETVRRFARPREIGVEICFEGGSKKKMRRWLGTGASLYRQVPGNLGERMYAAFLDAFQRGADRVVLLGTDIPQLRANHLEQAFDALAENDLVIGPSTDGGYWLIGLNRPVDLFEGIKWSTDAVFGQTLYLAKGQGLRVKTHSPLKDIDTAEDLKQVLPGWAAKGPYVSVVIPALNEAVNIEATIKKAMHEDAEIIVVDGGSIDNTVEIASSAGVRVVTGPRGRAVQQNLGAKIATGRVLLFLHADTLLPTGYVNYIFEILMDRKTVAGAFRFKTNFDHPAMKVIELLTNIRSRYLKLPYGDQGLFILKSVFESVGGFPEVPVAEDLFLIRRLSKYGRIRITPAHALTSARRWQTLGLFRTTLINQIILIGCCLGVSPGALASIYRFTVSVHRHRSCTRSGRPA
ncbi:MAG: TIGR04283 family arsenosugar biosynthesis glycosyltransferase [Deltaproteobacteria bacterium]|nr:TIGR04283 family arsenosugar biosynthesis glycosyltransferase [Deltaproteobacteria bacterium]